MITKVALLTLLAAGSAMGSIAQTQDKTTHWNDPILWGGTAPDGNNDYTSTMMLRTTSSSASTFQGRTLTMLAGGTVGLRNYGTVNALHMAGGIISHLTATTNVTLDGTAYIDADTTIDMNVATSTTNLAAKLVGSHTITVTNGNTASANSRLFLKGTGSPDFSGDWIITNNAKVVANVANSMGTGNIHVAATGSLDLNYALNNPNSSLTLDGLLVLDQDLTFSQVTIAGQSLAAGSTYSFAELNSLFDANFADGGSGSITVAAVPESASAVLLAAGVAGLLIRRKSGVRA